MLFVRGTERGVFRGYDYGSSGPLSSSPSIIGRVANKQWSFVFVGGTNGMHVVDAVAGLCIF